MIRSNMLACAAVAIAGAAVSAQSSPAGRDTVGSANEVAQRLIRSIEAEGERYGRSPLVDWIPPKSFATATGTAERKCQAPIAATPPQGSNAIVIGTQPVRSGDFVIGG